jgi:ATP-dependent RNA helicase RhlE
MKFSDFDLKPALLQALEEMGYAAPTPIQERTIPTLLQGGDVIGCAQTGTGKTAAFALPVLQSIKPGASTHPQALIITPTRELAEQIFQSIQDYTRFMPVSCVAIYGGVPSRPQEAALKKGVDIVVATPGRLLDLLQKPSLRLYDVRFLILDEADRMLDMGFIPDVENIVSYVPRTRQTLLFSATMPPEIEKLARTVTRTQAAELIVVGERSSSADTVTQWVCKVGDRDKMPLLTQLLKNAEMVSTIIFTRTKMGCAELSRRLDEAGVTAMAIHSNLSQTQRQNALDRFKRGECRILVATDIAARGLDIEKVSHVINFDTPTHPEDYVHRVGRTGRALAKGEAFTFVAPAEVKHLKNIERLIQRELPEYSFGTQETASRENKATVKAKPAAKTGGRPEKSKSQSDKKNLKPDAKKELKFAPKSEAVADSKTEDKPLSKSEAKTHAKPEPKREAKKVLKSEGKKNILPIAEPETKLEQKREPKKGSKPHSKRDSKLEAKSEPRSATKPAPKTEPKKEPRPAKFQPKAVEPEIPSEAVYFATQPKVENQPAHKNQTGYQPRQNNNRVLTPAKPLRRSQEPLQETASAVDINAHRKLTHSARIAKSSQQSSTTNSRFFRHEDDVNWLEED